MVVLSNPLSQGSADSPARAYFDVFVFWVENDLEVTMSENR
jgi:hypothetical protein